METLIQRTHQQFVVREAEDVGALRRVLQSQCAAFAPGETEMEAVYLIATELATNLLRHAQRGGYVLARALDVGAGGVELVAVDRGPGIANIDEALRSHELTRAAFRAGEARPTSFGMGLASVRRLAHEFAIHSTVPDGSAVLARVFFGRRTGSGASPFDVGGVSVPLAGYSANGDGWAYCVRQGQLVLVVVDGLGHGPDAELAAQAALRTFREHAGGTLVDLAMSVHTALRGTRGASASFAHVDPAAGKLQFMGVGNVEGRLVGNGVSRGMVSFSGTLGMGVHPPRMKVLEYPWTPDVSLLMHSDGIRCHGIAERTEMLRQHPALAAAVLHRDYCRGNDDATVLLARSVAP